jgi:glutaredoxin 3
MKKHFTVVIYTSGSQFCNLAKEYFRAEGIDYEEIKVGEDPKMLDMLRQKSGGITTPVVEIDGRIIVGFRPDLYETILRKGAENTNI